MSRRGLRGDPNGVLKPRKGRQSTAWGDRPELCTRLNLAPEQIEAIHQAIQEGRRQTASVAMGSRPAGSAKTDDLQGFLRHRDEAWSGVRAATSREVSRILAKTQRARYRAMLGEPFDFSRPVGQARKSAEGSEKP